eukprot:TRINITY_DN15303_c0_g1_i1.p1 TRINITY_DN15303_c0_g1~~TRINITY_DN15303_c0_g1_i1.p1  ORF type:complete len:228 (+),score=18.61 TRINITY_DN15303_c0_g1_i1:452-1135(+)
MVQDLDVCISSHTSAHPWPVHTKFICPICNYQVKPFAHPNVVRPSPLIHSQKGLQYWRYQIGSGETLSLFDNLIKDCPTFGGPERLPFTALKTPLLAILTCANCRGALLNTVSFWRDSGGQWVTASMDSPPHPVPTWLANQFTFTPRMEQVLQDHRKIIDFFALHGLEIQGAADDEDEELGDFDWTETLCPVKLEPMVPEMPLQEKLLRWEAETPVLPCGLVGVHTI